MKSDCGYWSSLISLSTKTCFYFKNYELYYLRLHHKNSRENRHYYYYSSFGKHTEKNSSDQIRRTGKSSPFYMSLDNSNPNEFTICICN